MNNKIDIAKAIGIILVVMAHACAPTYVSLFSNMLSVSIFFVTAGFCFNTKYLSDQTTFLKKRLKGLYLPFWKWSVFFLLLNHLWFYIGILSEEYGNIAGGVQHPLSWHQGMQMLWSITFNMSGYDQFLCGAYWFFRAFLIVCVLWILLMSVLDSLKTLKGRYTVSALVVGGGALLLALLHSACGLTITGVAQGGFRELIGLFFFAFGFMARQALNLCSEPTAVASTSALSCAGMLRWMYSHRLACTLAALSGIMLILYCYPVQMVARAKNVLTVFVLPVSGMLGFILLCGVACLIDGSTGMIKRAFLHIGRNTLYVFGFHLLAMKLVSMAIVLINGMEWGMVGCHPAISSGSSSWFWIAYTVVGVGLPLVVKRYYDLLFKRRKPRC